MKHLQYALVSLVLLFVATACETTYILASHEPAKPVFMGNTSCPISGFDSDPAKYAEEAGQRVYFCCSNCLTKGQAETAKYIAAAYSEPTPVGNTTCPVSGNEVSDSAAQWQGHAVALCCSNCDTAFAKDPGKYTEVALGQANAE